MGEQLGAFPAMDHGCKRKRSSKFDSHRHHVRNIKPADDQTDNCVGQKSEATKHRGVRKSVFAMQPDPVLAGIRPLLQRRQTTVIVDAVMSTAVVSIGVDISGQPTGTFTTTLPIGLSSVPGLSAPSTTSKRPSSTFEAPTSPSRSAASGSEPSAAASASPRSSASKSTAVSSSRSRSTPTPALSSTSHNHNGTVISTTSGQSPRISHSSLSSNSSRSSGTSIVVASAVSLNSTIPQHSSSHKSSSHSSTSHSSLTSTHSRSSSTRSSITTTTSFSGSSGTSSVGVPGLLGGIGLPSTSSAPDHNSKSGDGQQTETSAGVIAGSVVGSVAGVAFILLLVMYFLRRYQRRNGTLDNSRSARAIGAEDPFIDPAPSSGGAMTQQSGAFVPAAMGLLSRMTRHQEPAPEPQTPERGFQKISGRKLPSQFSPGMGTEPLQLPPTSGGPVAAAGPAYAYGAAKKKDIGDEEEDVGASPTSHHSPFDNNNEASDDGISEVTDWYRGSSIHTAPPPGTASTGLTQFTALQPHANTGRGHTSSTYSVDSTGTHPGQATSALPPPMISTTIPETERLMPSPARTPTVRHANSPKGLWAPGGAPGFGHGAGSRLSAESEAATPVTPKGTLGRSHPSYDGSRGSKFTEGVD